MTENGLYVSDALAPGTYTSERAASGAWVMFKGTPYEHLMVPVK